MMWYHPAALRRFGQKSPIRPRRRTPVRHLPREPILAVPAGATSAPAASRDRERVEESLELGLVRSAVWEAIVKVFVSSLIGGYGRYRAVAQEAIETLGHQVLRAEDFPASAGTPQQACLGAVRDSDLVVLLMGERYGVPQPSGLSATHEEYREAKERKPVLVLVESEVTREPAQQAFLDEVQAWATGHFRGSYSSVEELRSVLLRALHDHELATSAGPVDEAELVARATALLARPQGFAGAAQLVVAVAGGPYQQVVRPADLDEGELSRDLQREALFGQHPVLDPSEGTSRLIQGNALVFEQRVASVLVDQAGSVRVVQAARHDADRRQGGLSAVIEEDVVDTLARALRFSGWLLDRVDPLRRLTDVAPIVQLAGGGYLPWRTRAERAASPNAAPSGAGGDQTTVMLTPARRHRQALTHDPDRIAEDLAVLLRRERRR
jgi:hypothetical protein